MAIAFNTATFDSWTTGTTHTMSHTCSWTNRILFYCALYVWTDSITGVTYAGVPMTRVDKVPWTWQWIDMWYLVNPATWANNIVATTSVANTLYSQSASYTGAAQSWQLDAINKVWPTWLVTSQYTSVTTVSDNCWLVWCLNSSSTSMAAWTGTTFRAWVNNSIKIADSNWAKTPPWSYSLWVTVPNATTSQIVCSFKPSIGSTQSPFLLFMD